MREVSEAERTRFTAIFEQTKTRPSLGDPSFEFFRTNPQEIRLEVCAWDATLTKAGVYVVAERLNNSSPADEELDAAVKTCTRALCDLADNFKSTEAPQARKRA